MAKIIKTKALKEDKTYEPPLAIGFGIDHKTIEDPKMVMGYTFIPPGGRNQRHYHVKNPAGMYIIKGRMRAFIGPDHNKQEFIIEAGDFVYVPQGEIHGIYNLSETEPAELVFCYPGVSSKEEAQTIFVEPPWK